MKLVTVKHLTFSGLKNIWANKLMSIASVGILIACMSIIGLAVILTANVDKTLGDLEQENVVMVYFNDMNSVIYGGKEISSGMPPSSEASAASNSSATSSQGTDKKPVVPDSAYLIHNDDEANALCEKLRGIDNVSTVEYISSEEGLRRMKESMLEGQDQYFKFLDDDNPLSCSAKITMNDLSKFDETINAIKVVSGVDSIQSHGEVAAKITSIKNGVGIAAMWIIGILMIIALVIVSNTIRVTMYNRKLEISIMKAVGATDSYIRIPFLIEGVTIGIVSAVVTTGLLYFVYKAVIETMKNALSLTQVIAYKEFLWPLLGMFAAIGVLAGLIGSVFMIGKYLKREGSEFRAL